MIGIVTRLIGGMFTPLIDQASASTARLLRKLALFLVAAVALVVVLIALTVAFDLWVSSQAGPIVGALAVAGLYLLVAVVAVVFAIRPARRPTVAQNTVEEEQAAQANAGRIDEFAAPLLGILESLGLRKEQLAVLAGTSVAKQLGPLPLVGLALVGGFLVGRMWEGLRGLIDSDLVAGLMSSDLMTSLFGRRDPQDDRDEAA